MWNRLNDNDILDFALLWEPLGGPARRMLLPPSQSILGNTITDSGVLRSPSWPDFGKAPPPLNTSMVRPQSQSLTAIFRSALLSNRKTHLSASELDERDLVWLNTEERPWTHPIWPVHPWRCNRCLLDGVQAEETGEAVYDRFGFDLGAALVQLGGIHVVGGVHQCVGGPCGSSSWRPAQG